MKRSKLPASVWLAAVAALLVAIPADAAKQYTYVDILRQMSDLDRLTRLQTGFRAGQFSSWDRNETTIWGVNGDAGHYMRVEPNGEAVMVDIDGPGCIYRIWSANPQGKLNVYLDGSEQPSFVWDFNDLFKGGITPFVRPLVWQREDRRASDCYVPIPFAKHIKITADKKHGQYYHFGYLIYPTGSEVPSLRLPLTPLEQTALTDQVAAWSSPGRDPKPAKPNQRVETRTLEIAPGKTELVALLDGPASIRSIRVKAVSEQRSAWRKLLLRATWDRASWPQVLTPIGPFFGFDWDEASYGSVLAGCKDGTAYQFLPMPFRKSAKVEIISTLDRPARVAVDIEWAPEPELPADMTYFYARWRREPDATTFDYPILDTAGRGHFVGVSLPIDHPLPGWWGEGDEKIWVDDDDFPPWIGTGSEDYFGDAWGIRYLSGGSWGCSAQTAHRTCNYRWHFMDLVPFEKRFRMTMENYGPNGVGPRGQYEYSSTAFWYQAEPTPPFATLAGVKITGGDSPGGKPVPKYHQPNIFRNLDAAAVRTYGLGVTFATEFEDLLRDAVRAGSGSIVSDAGQPFEYNRERAVEFADATPGRTLAEFEFTVPEAGVYWPRLYTSPEAGLADLTLEIDDTKLEVTGKPEARVAALSGRHLAAGSHRARLIAVTSGRAVVDCLQMQPAAKQSGVTEAEETPVVRVTNGAEAPHPSPAIAAASSGRILEWHADKVGQGLVLKITKRPAGAYTLGARTMRGPNGGIIQAHVADKPIGPAFDIYAPEKRPSPVVWPLGLLPAGADEVEIRIVGKNPASAATHAGIDYFKWEPLSFGPETSAGVWGLVLGTQGCDYTSQDLGPAWTGGHHLWVNPSGPGATIDFGITVPTDGEYDMIVRYTSSWDYATIQASVNGIAIGQPVDCWSSDVKLMEPVVLGRVRLYAGQRVLQLKASGRNPESKGHLMGIESITVRAAR